MVGMVELLVVLIVLAAVGVAALVVGVLALTRGRRGTEARGGDVASVPADVEGLRREVAALKAESADALRHLAVVRYDAFGDVGGHLSWSLALLDDGGNGVVLSSIHGRSEARTYAKSIAGWSCEQQLSPEEDEAIAHARPGALG